MACVRLLVQLRAPNCKHSNEGISCSTDDYHNKSALSKRLIVFLCLSDHLNTRRLRGLDGFVYLFVCLFGLCSMNVLLDERINGSPQAMLQYLK